jgi:hypothetical protein
VDLFHVDCAITLKRIYVLFAAQQPIGPDVDERQTRPEPRKPAGQGCAHVASGRRSHGWDRTALPKMVGHGVTRQEARSSYPANLDEHGTST